jgi:phosphoribosylamine--glycine ligase
MKILLIGSGGREHAFAFKLKQSSLCSKLFIAPGNAGTALCGTNIQITVNEFYKLGDFCKKEQIGLVIVGPEDPLVNGIRNYFEKDAQLKTIPFVGPDAAGAQLEGSKDFSKAFMQKYHIPTAKAATFTIETYKEGENYLMNHSLPIVLKADGLAAGKGVVICETKEQALSEFNSFIKESKFGEASKKVLIEEFLTGIELSVFVLTDGKHYKILPEAKDYKRIGEKDTGPNTGGMGAISPVPFADAAFMEKVEKNIILPTINGLKNEGIQYTGFIFIGLMNDKGEPKVIEYNCRMGDPETEVVLPRITSDVAQLMLACGKGELTKVDLVIAEQYATTVMLVSGGYPNDYQKGKLMTGMEDVKDSILFHAGTSINTHGEVVTNGGRVMAITSFGDSLNEALGKSLTNATRINFEGKYYRKDIGFEFLEKNV